MRKKHVTCGVDLDDVMQELDLAYAILYTILSFSGGIQHVATAWYFNYKHSWNCIEYLN